jgi:hypothetical protein
MVYDGPTKFLQFPVSRNDNFNVDAIPGIGYPTLQPDFTGFSVDKRPEAYALNPPPDMYMISCHSLSSFIQSLIENNPDFRAYFTC